MNIPLSIGSVRVCHSDGDNEDKPMLMRRFSIVCLITAIFGMGLAILVAEASRPSDPWQNNRPFSCSGEQTALCGRTILR
ncbi:MAG: hypothetical protein CMH69_08820 [Nitratireductor sp.]|uniref:hypothetical protein n=2 Tax=Nitratireductor TaxID=245876 RepID=UPI000C94ED13|nr:hypothetical protein [Nitratireductor sp. B36]MAS13392.1 hypothetical protein [Nitratireductor sp.]